MPYSPQDATEALALVDQATRRSSMLRGYQSAAPHLILWGAVYAAAYTSSFIRPDQTALVWTVFVLAGVLGDVVIARRDKPGRVDYTRILTLSATFLVFITASALVMQPHDPRQMAAFVPLVVAAAYVVLGMRIGRRLQYTGLALAALTLIGFFALPTFFMLWMALVGGGALVMGGFWMART